MYVYVLLSHIYFSKINRIKWEKAFKGYTLHMYRAKRLCSAVQFKIANSFKPALLGHAFRKEHL